MEKPFLKQKSLIIIKLIRPIKTDSSKVPLADSEQELKVQKENFKGFSKLIKTSPRSQSINVLFLPAVKENEIQEVVFQKRAKNKTNDLTS
jgi:hypothetical protein